MEMTRELYDRIQETAQVQTLEIGSHTYTTENVHLVEDPIYKPNCFTVNTLCGLVSMIETEIQKISELPLIVHAEDYKNVHVYTTYDDRFKRSRLYSAQPELPGIQFERYMGHEEFMVQLRSKYVKTEDVDYLLRLLSSVVDENSVKSTDNGLSQKVEVHQGITTIGEETIRPIVTLAPYRTFLEVEQPESEFLVRLQEGGNIALFEADGGMWKLDAKNRIANKLREALGSYIANGMVVVTE